MSLRNQISIRILFFSLFILLLGGSVSIWQARQAVDKEVDSSINLVLQLIKIGTETAKIHQTAWIYHLSSLEQTRHLTIQLKMPSNEIINISHQSQLKIKNNPSPHWFTNLVIGQYLKVEHPIKTFDNKILTLVIQANPMDEIAEVWHETVAFFTAILSLILLTFLAVQLVFNKTLRTIQSIVDHLNYIETGDYQKRLPVFATQEYNDIALAINHMTGVLYTTQQQNHALTQHSLKIQEDERQWLSQELHDQFGQSLTAIKVMAVTATHEKSDTQQITTTIIEICEHLITIVRSMMKQLHPLMLTELGLKATLEDLVHHWRANTTQISFKLHCDEAVDKIDPSIVIHVFRVIQESLTNIIRHANANQVTIHLNITPSPNTLHLLITDDGQGCNLTHIHSGFGLLGMEERIKLLGGDFKIDSEIHKGMKIIAQIPLE
ncbi:MAG: sensor histidine kinase [Methylococcales bacterium]|nr:sensor histidine kinase [Methylococcales bacterium]